MKRIIFSFFKQSVVVLAGLMIVIACDEPIERDGNDYSLGQQTTRTIDELIEELAESWEKYSTMPTVKGNESEIDSTLEEYKQSLYGAAGEIAEKNGVENGKSSGKSSVKVKSVSFYYPSVDGNGNIDTLSGTVHYPVIDNKGIAVDNILLNCFATRTQGSEGGMMGAMYSVTSYAASGLLVIEPDYIGFGRTADKMQTYLCQKLIAKNCVDMIPYVIEAVNNNEFDGTTLKDGYGTYVMGYSQGGGNALAIMRLLTKEGSSVINFKGGVCGSGPYDPVLTYNTWVSNNLMSMSALLPMVIAGFKAGHPDLMNGVEPRAYFSEEYLASGVPDAIFNRTGGLAESSAYDASQGLGPSGTGTYWVHTIPMMSEAAKNPDSDMTKALLSCLEYEQIYKDWTPKAPVLFYRLYDDHVVPVENTEVAYETLKAKGGDLVSIKRLTDEGAVDHIFGTLAFVSVCLSKGYYTGILSE